MPAAETLADGRIRLPGGMAVDDAATLLETTWETDATTVGGLVTEALGTSCRRRRDGRRSAITSSKSSGSADRVVESVVARRVVPVPSEDDAVIEILIPVAIILLAGPGQRPVRRRRVRHRRRAAGEHRASGGAGQPAGQRALQHPRESRRCRIATSPRRRSASRSRASGSGMYGEHWLAESDRSPWLVPLRNARAGLPRTPSPASSRSPSSPTCTS